MTRSDPDLHFPGQGIEVTCRCGHLWRVPTSLCGGLVNCPACRQVVSVPRGGRPELLFWLILLGGALPFVVVAAVLFAVGSTAAGWLVLLAGAAVLGLAVLMM